MPDAEVGVFGGSGLYEFLDHVEELEIETPWGAPSAPIAVGTVDGRRVAFLPRHGRKHHLAPHHVNYRANLWALHELGVTRILSPFACGSLQRRIHPGDLVVCDQLVDRTSGRDDSYFSTPLVVHVSWADPYCDELRVASLDAARAEGATVHETGTVVVVQGPRFSTKAESKWFREQGWDVVNMTQYPEAYLARELGMCFAGIAVVTDYDAGIDGVTPVSYDEVMRVFEANIDRLRTILVHALKAIPAERACACASGTGGVFPNPPGR
jgi:5'-methylthioadenosine phosphorylase